MLTIWRSLADAAEAGPGRCVSGELRSINIHRQDSDPASEQTPPSRYTPSAALLPAGGHSSQHSSPIHAVAEGVHPLSTGWRLFPTGGDRLQA